MEMKKILESLQEHSMDIPTAPMQQGTPVSMNISLNASGKDHVADLISMMKNAGLGQAQEVGADTMPMRMDMERLRGIVDRPEMEMGEEEPCPECGMESCGCDHTEESASGGFDAATTEPDEEYSDLEAVIASGDDLHKSKRAFAKAQDGDNAMAVENIKDRLYAALTEKKMSEGELPAALKAYQDKKSKSKGKAGKKDTETAEGRGKKLTAGRGRGK
jgi:hypothetical protein